MLRFSRKSDSKFELHNISELLENTIILAINDYDLKKKYDFRKIKIVKEYQEDLSAISCEEGEIQQVFLNIMKNGAQAMHEAGTENPQLTIRTRFEKDRKMICIEIEDNGPGMDEATRKKVFEPFFTTKPVGVGTGLGLSVSYFIISENHKGSMAVESTLGKGTKFIIGLRLKPDLPERE